jgi:hypothetical protein
MGEISQKKLGMDTNFYQVPETHLGLSMANPLAIAVGYGNFA